MKDLRDDIFREIRDRSVTAVILADDAGMIAGVSAATEGAAELGLTVNRVIPEGTFVSAGDEVMKFSGNPKQIAMAEDLLMGSIAKPSGIASAARRCVRKAGEKVRIVCGSWKKMPVELKEAIRSAIALGGAHFRISSPPFIYLDKNYVRLLGGIERSLQAVSYLADHKKAIQIKGNQKDIAGEAVEAAQCGANIIYIDSGKSEDINAVTKALGEKGLRQRVEIAFGGNVRIEDIDDLKAMDVDMLCIGRQIIDAPLLDLKMEVVKFW